MSLQQLFESFGACVRSLKADYEKTPNYKLMAKELQNVINDPDRSKSDKQKAKQLIKEFMSNYK